MADYFTMPSVPDQQEHLQDLPMHQEHHQVAGPSSQHQPSGSAVASNSEMELDPAIVFIPSNAGTLVQIPQHYTAIPEKMGHLAALLEKRRNAPNAPAQMLQRFPQPVTPGMPPIRHPTARIIRPNRPNVPRYAGPRLPPRLPSIRPPMTVLGPPDAAGIYATAIPPKKPRIRKPRNPLASVIPHIHHQPPANGIYKPELLLATTLGPFHADLGTLFSLLRKLDKYSTVVDVAREKAVLDDVHSKEMYFEDRELVTVPLPARMILEWPEIPTQYVGKLLSLGHFIEMISAKEYADAEDRPVLDYEYIMKAVCIVDNDVGPYWTLLEILAHCFSEFRDEVPSEFWISILEVDRNEFLACEYIRQHLMSQGKGRGHKVSPSLLAVVRQLQTVDICDLMIEERIKLLTEIHDYLVHGTYFIEHHCRELNEQKDQAMNAMETAAADLAEITNALTEARSKLGDVPSGDDATEITRSISEEISELEAAYKAEDAKVKLWAAKVEEVERNLASVLKTRPLGLDRDHSRYWHFPELGDGVFVESGWLMNSLDFPKTNHLLPPLDSSGKLAHVFLLPNGNPDLQPYVHQPLLYTLSADGVIRGCRRAEYPPRPTPNTWFYYTPEQIPQLVDSLNPIGIRESQLKKNILATEFKISNRKPPKALSPSDALDEYFADIRDRLVNAMFLPPSSTVTQAADFEEFKRQIVTLFQEIKKELLVAKFREETEKWIRALQQTSNWSRIYYLLKVLDMSIRWEADVAVCKECGRSNRKEQMNRCKQCNDWFHHPSCSYFVSEICTGCRDASMQLDLDEVMDVGDVPENPSGRIPRKTMTGKAKGKPKKRRYESDSDEESGSGSDEETSGNSDTGRERRKGKYSFRQQKTVNYSLGDRETESEEQVPTGSYAFRRTRSVNYADLDASSIDEEEEEDDDEVQVIE